MTFGWSVLAVVGAVFGLVFVVAVFRLARDHHRVARGPAKWPDPNPDTTIAHYGHS